jgi:hypothetical protein
MVQIKENLRKKIDGQDRAMSRLASEAAGYLATWLEEQARGLLREGTARGKASSSNLRRQLKERGLDAVLSRTQAAYEQTLILVENIMGDVTGKPFEYASTNRAQLETLISYSQLGVVKQLSTNIEGLRNSIAATVLLGAEPNYEALESRLVTLTRAQLTTEYETEVAAFHRAANDVAAEQAGIERFVYYGGLINDSRSFCRAHAGNIYTKEELSRMDNGQGLPVIPYLGGYNCRHFLVPVPDEEDRVVEEDNDTEG